jgi:signal transduction histidine kinase
MSSPTERSLLEAWRQGWPFPGTIVPYVVLVVSATSATTSQWGSVSVNLALCAVAAVWMLIPLHPALRKRIPVMAGFLAGLIAITAVLVIRDPWFGFFVVAGYGYSIRLMPWPWSLPCTGAFGVLAATAQTWSVNKATPAGLAAYLAVIAVNILAVCGIVWFLHGIEKAHDQRKRALDELSEANRRLEATLAENEGLHRQLLTQAREAGILDERQRIAREIHDTLAQGLTGIITQLQAAEHAAGEPAAWRKHFAAATRLARESLSEARRSVDALRPEPLETGRLSEALAGVAGRWSELHGIKVTVTTTGTMRPMRPEAEVALLRTAQEALANVAKHAEATRVGVTLSYLEHEVALDVRDDGRGFDPALLCGSRAGIGGKAASPAGDEVERPGGAREPAVAEPAITATAGRRAAGKGPPPDGLPGANGNGLRGKEPDLPQAGGRGPDSAQPSDGGPNSTGGFGLVAMRQRIEALSGTVQVESEPGAGTGISARVPAAIAEARP